MMNRAVKHHCREWVKYWTHLRESSLSGGLRKRLVWACLWGQSGPDSGGKVVANSPPFIHKFIHSEATRKYRAKNTVIFWAKNKFTLFHTYTNLSFKWSFKPQHWQGEWFLQEGVSRVASLWFIEGNWCSSTFGNEIKKRLWGRIIAVCLLGNKLDVFLLQKSCHRSTPIGCACVFVFLMVMMLSSDRIPDSIDIRFE